MSGLPLTPRAAGLLGSRTIPNFVARTTSLAPPTDSLADEFFIRERAVHVRRIQKIDAEFQRAVNRGQRLSVVACAIKFRHPHAAQTERRNCKTAIS